MENKNLENIAAEFSDIISELKNHTTDVLIKFKAENALKRYNNFLTNQCNFTPMLPGYEYDSNMEEALFNFN